MAQHCNRPITFRGYLKCKLRIIDLFCTQAMLCGNDVGVTQNSMLAVQTHSADSSSLIINTIESTRGQPKAEQAACRVGTRQKNFFTAQKGLLILHEHKASDVAAQPLYKQQECWGRQQQSISMQCNADIMYLPAAGLY